MANFWPVNLANWPNWTKWQIFLRDVKVATVKEDKVANILRWQHNNRTRTNFVNCFNLRIRTKSIKQSKKFEVPNSAVSKWFHLCGSLCKSG